MHQAATAFIPLNDINFNIEEVVDIFPNPQLVETVQNTYSYDY